VMVAFVPGAPYLFACRKCNHHFQREINLGLFCPACKSPHQHAMLGLSFQNPVAC